MTDPFNLERFVRAQDDGGTYERAEKELRRGRKQSHWMWFVFPQLRGLVASGTVATDKYAIGSPEEAAAYLEHDVLGPRLHRCAQLVVRSGAVNANTLMGGHPDDRKLKSSMTLFAEVANDDGDAADFVAVLRKYYRGERDAKTLRLLKWMTAPAATPPSAPSSGRRRRFWPSRRGDG